MRTKGVRLMILVTAVTLALATGCASNGQASAAPKLEKTHLTVAVVPALDSAGFFIALYRGLFKARGLTITFVPATSSQTVIAGQVAGRYDITGGNYVSYIQAQAAGQANLDIFAEGSVMGAGAQDIYTTAGSPIKTLAGLEGKTIAINAPDNILYLLVASVLAENGLSTRRVHFVTKYAFPMIPGELRAGVVDAAVLPEPFASIAEEDDGAVPLADLNQGATTDFPIEGYVVTKKWAEQNPHTLAAFYAALEQGQQIADSSRSAVEQAMEDLPKPLAVSPDIAALMSLDTYPVSTGPVGSVDRTRLERVVQVMQEFLGFGSFNIDSMLMSNR